MQDARVPAGLPKSGFIDLIRAIEGLVFTETLHEDACFREFSFETLMGQDWIGLTDYRKPVAARRLMKFMHSESLQDYATRAWASAIPCEPNSPRPRLCVPRNIPPGVNSPACAANQCFWAGGCHLLLRLSLRSDMSS